MTPANGATHQVALMPNEDWRTEYSVHLNNQIMIRNRVELIWVDKDAKDYEKGFMELADLFYKPRRKFFSGNIRLQYFETDGFNSRIYVYEDDVLYNYSIPFFYGKGFRYYVNLNVNLAKMLSLKVQNKTKIEGWLKWLQSVYPSNTTIGTGLDQISGTHKSEITVQVIAGW